MKPEIKLKDHEKSFPVKVYVAKVKGKYIISHTPIPGATVEWYASKVDPRLYYGTKYEAQQRSNQYNKKRAAQIKGQQKEIINKIMWDWFSNSPVQNDQIWWHEKHENPGPWLYEHAWMGDWEYWFVDQLLDEDMAMKYEDNHDNFDFFAELFKLYRYTQYYLDKTEKGKWRLWLKR